MTPYFFTARLEPGTYDAKAGCFRGVSIITEGVAKGHGMLIDGTTIAQVKACAAQFKNGVKVKADHWTGVAQIIGRIAGLEIDDSSDASKLRGDLYLLKNLQNREFYQEILDVFADAIGLSITCAGSRETIDGLDYLRVVELRSIDLVDDPAANPDGMFSRGSVDSGEGDVMPKAILAALTAADLDSQLTGLSAADSLTALRAAFVSLSCDCQNKRQSLETQVTAITGERDAAKTELATAQTKATELTTQLGTVTKERDDAKTQLGTMTSERDTAKTELATSKTELGTAGKERDGFRTQLEQLASRGLIPTPQRPESADALKTNEDYLKAYNELANPTERAAFWAKHEDKLTS